MTDFTIHTLDLHFQGVSKTIAAYLIETSTGPVLVETGPESTLNTLKERLAAYGYAPEDVKHVFVTHIHFDHAGAAGWWAQNGATIYVHHIGAPHLIQPERLIMSARRIYKDEMETLWGEIIPAPAENVVSLFDGDTIKAAGVTLQAWDTPGHARHHHVYTLDDIAFTGDAGGMKLGDHPLLDFPAPPPEFDLEAWEATLDKLQGMKLALIYPTHFGPENAVTAQLSELKQLIREAAFFIQEQMSANFERDEIVRIYTEWNYSRAQKLGLDHAAWHRYNVANPLDMSVDGIMRYWRKKGAPT